MQATHTACVIAVVLTGVLTAQGGGRTGSPIRSVAPRYPVDRDMARFVPFVDKNAKELRVGPIACGAADFDGDKNVDLWFLGHGDKPGEIAVQFGNTASLGRFYRRDSVATSNFVSATTYHTSTSSVSQLLVIDPASEDPMLLHWNPKKKGGDPRDGYLGGSLSGWKIGKGVTEIAAADHAQDGHDDIVALQALSNNSTAIHKLVMGTQKFNYLWVEQRITAIIPAKLENLHILDINGDGRSDIVASSPGIGVLVCRDTGKGGFEVAGFWPTSNLPIKDIAVGDLDGNGLHDIAICFDQGIVVMEAISPGGAKTNPWRPRYFLNPKTIGNLATCRIVNVDGRGTMVVYGFPADGKSYVIHPHNPSAFGIVKPWVEPAPSWMVGAGVIGRSLIVADVDNDRDNDLVIQSPDGVDWMTLRNPYVSFAPIGLTDFDKGPAPNTEGPKSRRLNVIVDIPQAVIDANILFVEIGMYVKEPKDPNVCDDESWLYWGRLMPAIDTNKKNASFTVFFDEDPNSFKLLVETYKKKRAANINTFFDVYPKGEWETIRGGPNMFMTVHAVDMSRRFESVNGDEPPTPRGSTLGGKWVLVAKPPSPKGDLELLPFE